MRTESDVTSGRADADTEKAVDSLNKLLRGELSAVETYAQALERLQGSAAINQLAESMRSHQERAETLRQQVVQLGGQPSEGSGPWGAFAKLIEGGAKLFGEKAAVAALEEGEDHGLKDYRTHLTDLDIESRRIIEQQVLPEEQQTHLTMSTLKKNLELRV